ncbi:hypothetical protein, partial [Salmonella enterica]
MSRGIIIIGSGFAARQLVKNIRKQDAGASPHEEPYRSEE